MELLNRKEHISRDSQQYILRRLETDPKLKSFVTKDSAELLNQLHIKASGCFIYLEIILNLINNQTISLRQIKEIPGTLSGTFTKSNMKGIIDSSHSNLTSPIIYRLYNTGHISLLRGIVLLSERLHHDGA